MSIQQLLAQYFKSVVITYVNLTHMQTSTSLWSNIHSGAALYATKDDCDYYLVIFTGFSKVSSKPLGLITLKNLHLLLKSFLRTIEIKMFLVVFLKTQMT